MMMTPYIGQYLRSMSGAQPIQISPGNNINDYSYTFADSNDFFNKFVFSIQGDGVATANDLRVQLKRDNITLSFTGVQMYYDGNVTWTPSSYTQNYIDCGKYDGAGAVNPSFISGYIESINWDTSEAQTQILAHILNYNSNLNTNEYYMYYLLVEDNPSIDEIRIYRNSGTSDFNDDSVFRYWRDMPLGNAQDLS